jgi:hydrogenase maturation factor
VRPGIDGVAPQCAPDEHCVTCGDTAVPVRVLEVDEGRELALCADEAGERTTVETALVAPVARGDVLLVHAGTAIARTTEEETPA